MARLVASGRVKRRDGEFEARHPEVARPFVADITRRLPPARGMDTIRPNRKKQAKKRRK